MEVIKLTNDNIEEIRELYNEFTESAQQDFLFELSPIGFDDFKANFSEGFIKSYMYKNPYPEGFMLYSDNLTQGLEITLIFNKNKSENITTYNAILTKFLDDAKKLYPNKIVSYPMLGLQNAYSQEIKKLGFSPVNEKILEFDFKNNENLNILQNANIKTLPKEYSVTSWNNEYFDNATQIIFEEFSKTNDVKFDPRFNNTEGTKNVLNSITSGYYGDFLPQATTILKYNNTPVGYCFVNLTSNEIANIPLLVLNKEHHNKGLGTFLVNNSLNITKELFITGEIKANLINTTCDADNISALKTYLRNGFIEKTSYTHAYINL